MSRALCLPAALALVFAAMMSAVKAADQADLQDQADLRVDGAFEFDLSGWSVDGVGDVNGDGVGDIVIGTSDNAGRRNFGRAYVIFGGTDRTRIDLRDLGTAGFRIRASAPGDFTGRSVAGAGDVNGDGLDDLLIGASWADNNRRENSGSAYIVFGKSSEGAIRLGDLGSNGYRIDGATTGEFAGASVSGVGDVNGDSRADVIVGAPLADANARQNSGSAYVVFGKDSSDSVDLAVLGLQGFRIDGAANDDTAGWSVSHAGDVDGDGLGDLLVGAPARYGDAAGSAYVVFGRATAAPVDLNSLGDAGYSLTGSAPGDLVGRAIAGAGDVNNDGVPDAVVGAPGADSNGRPQSGSAYVVVGQRDGENVDLQKLDSDGYRIDGAASLDQLGRSVSGVGDLNGDGMADLMLGAPFAAHDGKTSGSVYVALGSIRGQPIDLRRAVDGVFRFDGARRGDLAGQSVGGTDFDGDDLTDLIIGSPGADRHRRRASGSVHLIFGFTG